MIEVLEDYLMSDLNQAQNVYIATALLSLPILKKVSERLPTQAKIHWLVGIDLPTHPDVLETLMKHSFESDRVHSKVFISRENFHPKVYIIVRPDGTISAYVGSANATAGGFKNNIEMTFRIVDNTQCSDLIFWFNSLFENGREIRQDFLDKYRRYFYRVQARNASSKSDTDQLKRSFSLAEISGSNPIPESYFQNVDYAAFGPDREKDKGELAASDRRDVWTKFVNIHENIYQRFDEYGLAELKCHHDKRKIVSAHYHSPFTRARKDAIWLNYGYTATELAGSKLMDHPRIQVILRSNRIGLWLVIGKNNGSRPERDRFREKIETDAAFLTLFFTEILNLGGTYELEINDDFISHKLQISDIVSESQLKDFVLFDESRFYFTIRRNFFKDDVKLLTANIFETVLIEFCQLLPIYRLFKIA